MYMYMYVRAGWVQKFAILAGTFKEGPILRAFEFKNSVACHGHV